MSSSINASAVPGLIEFVSEDRVRKGAEKLQKILNTKQQGRLDGFFTTKPKDKAASTAKPDGKSRGTKRKVSERHLFFHYILTCHIHISER